MIIAIDGPSASGKSTVARKVATELGYVYVDSGALYRGVTWQVLRTGADTGAASSPVRLMQDMDVQFFLSDNAVRFSIDGIVPGNELRTETVNGAVSKVAAVPEVRAGVIAWLRDMVRFGNLVMEGRDIGTAVFKDAQVKFYLDASLEERARRRHAEMETTEQSVTVTGISESIRQRDTIDSTREMDPLHVAPGAIVIDTTEMTLEDVARHIVARARNRKREHR